MIYIIYIEFKENVSKETFQRSLYSRVMMLSGGVRATALTYSL